MLLDEERTAKPDRLIPLKDSIPPDRSINVLGDSVCVRPDLSKVGETRSSMNTQKDHLENLILIFSVLVTSSHEKKRLTLENYNCGIGFASKGSVPDGMVVDDQGFPRGIFEVKDNTMTPTEATRQGIAEAYNVALGHLKLGVSYSDVMVPIVGSNGYLMEAIVPSGCAAAQSPGLNG